MTTVPSYRPDDDRRLTAAGRAGWRRRNGESREVTGLAELDAPCALQRRPSVVLFVGEDPSDVRMLEELLQNPATEPFELVTVGRSKAALERVSQGDVDVVLLDLSFPGGVDSFAALSGVKSLAPFIVLSRAGEERLALDAVRAGAQDSLVKGRLDGPLLAQSLRYAIERHRMRNALGDQLLLDELTGLHNRRGFVTLATQDLGVARREKRSLLVAFGDLDGLKQINDTLGHAEGDAALRDVAGILRRTFRDSDLIARIGGDEYAVLVRSAEANGVEALRRRLNHQLTEFNGGSQRYRISISIGFAHRQAEHVTSVESLLNLADRALYLEKRRRVSEARLAGTPVPRGATLSAHEGRPIEILLVEDEPDDIELTQLALTEAKLQNRLSVVHDGADALAFLRGQPPYEATLRPDVVLLDLNLPKLDGRQVLEEMREDSELRDIPVVILTGTNAEHTELASLRPDAFLTKPVDFERLAQAVGTVANLGFTIVKLPA